MALFKFNSILLFCCRNNFCMAAVQGAKTIIWCLLLSIGWVVGVLIIVATFVTLYIMNGIVNISKGIGFEKRKHAHF